MERDATTGRFKKTTGKTKTAKGYIRITAGPLRGQYEHRVVAAEKLGRPLANDEDVHHCNQVRHHNHPNNLQVLGHREHGWVSALQHFWMNYLDIHLEAEWNEYFKGDMHNDSVL